VVRRLCQGRNSLEELREVSLIDGLCQELLSAQRPSSPSLKQELLRLAPDTLMLPRGRRVRVHYESGKPPWVASRLQDFFGMQQGPTVLSGRVAVVLHLLAPNQRAVQVTTDLSGFFSRHYPAIRKELCRRYPKHAWPEDPLSSG
jgi:ATP-dependent helicase HrpB